VLDSFKLYDLYIVSFLQLVVATVLVLSPARFLDSRLRWTGSRITEVVLDALGAAAIAAVSAGLAIVLWGLPANSAGVAAYVLVVCSLVVIVARPDSAVVGKVFYAAYASAGFTFLGYAALVAANATRSIAEAITASVLLILDLWAFLIWNSNVNYVSDVMSRTRRSRPLPEPDPTYQPFVSLHLPAYNEPPELLIETIKAVEQIDYPNFEIVVMDNNTTDPAIWGPVEEYCRDRERVTFVHVAPWPGYKAGACNLALRQYTDPRAEIIGMVDADDIVKPYYLRETAPYFSDERLGFVQTFEGNREYEGSAYYTACVDSYQGFYLGVMSSRNERDTVPFVGTMGLFRRSALEGVGGWNEWCISEDTEASLRVLKAGWSGVYIPRCFGRGIVPPTFGGLNTQRHRWCFGAMQILRLHWRSLMPWDRSPDNHLTAAQRRDYLMASLGWFRDLMMLGFALLLLVVTGLLLSDIADRDGHDLHVVEPLPLDRHVMAPRVQRSGDQSLGVLDHRARVHTGHDAPRGGLPPHLEDRFGPPPPAQGSAADSGRDGSGGIALRCGRAPHRFGESADPVDRDRPAARERLHVRSRRGAVEHAGAASAGGGVPAAVRGEAAPAGTPAGAEVRDGRVRLRPAVRRGERGARRDLRRAKGHDPGPGSNRRAGRRSARARVVTRRRQQPAAATVVPTSRQ
jgi:hypothetical protein